MKKWICSLILAAAVMLTLGIAVSAEMSGDFTYEVNEDGVSATITGYSGTGGDVVIPEKIDGYTVTVVGETAFFECRTISGISFPKGLTSIECKAFYKCENLKEVVFQEGIISIGEEAFYYCKSLISVTFPKSLSVIGEMAFYMCKSMTNIAFSEGLKSIGGHAFSYCSSLTDIILPEGLSTISRDAFSYCQSLTNVTLPESISSIGYHSFFRCKLLTDITFPEGLSSIEGYAFGDCESLTKIIFPEALAYIGKKAFVECDQLTKVYFYGDIPSAWGENVFEDIVTIYYQDNTSGWTSPTWNAPDGTIYNTNGFATQYLQVTKNNPGWTYYIGEDIHVILTNVIEFPKYGSTDVNRRYSKPENFVIANSNESVLTLKRYNDVNQRNDYIEYVFSAEEEGMAVLSIEDIINKKTIYLPITVVEDALNSYRADKVPVVPYDIIVAKDEYNYFINGIYISDFEYSKNKDGTWQYTFNAYNESYTPGVVEIYDADGKLLEIEIINKYISISSFKDIINVGGDMIGEIFKGDTFSFRGVSTAKQTPISIKVPQDGFVRITNSSAISYSCLFVGMFDYLFTGLKLIDSAYDFVDTDVKDYITKETLLTVLSTEYGVNLLSDIQKKFVDKAWGEISENLMAGYYQMISGDIDKLFKVLEIDLVKIAKDSVNSTLLGDAQKAIEIYGGPAGLTLKWIFTIQNAADFICQSRDLSDSAQSRVGVDIYTPNDRSKHELTAFDGNYITSISELSPETIFQVFKLTDNKEIESIESIADYELYEISLQVDGEDYQPDEPVTVYLRKPYNFNENMILYRQDKNGEWEEIQYATEKGMLVFQIDHFCLFAIIEHFKPGDVNQDGSVNELDSNLLISYFSGHPVDVTITPDTADLNGDNLVTRADAMILARYLAKWPGYAEKYFQ